jgi:predicted MPP superfamily phosphohydrolase
MVTAAYATLLLFALLGHAALWTGLVNRIHSTGMPRWAVKWLSRGSLAAVLAIPPVLVAIAWPALASTDAALWPQVLWRQGVYYFLPCIGIALLVAAFWLRRQIAPQSVPGLRHRHSKRIDIAATLGFVPVHGWYASLCSRVPGNDLFRPAIEEVELEFSRLPTALDGVKIVHLSDFHFTGRVGIEYYQEVVRQANAIEPDLIALTGDLVDFAEFIDWLPETVGRLRAPAGVYFVLGNHDLRTRDVHRLRQTLTSQGLVDLGGRWQTVDIRGESLALAGNELPWIGPAADMRTCVSAALGAEHDRPLRILLSHSPDQFAWAQRWDFDLVLAGHTHGGQIRLPWIGPLLSPSWYGVRFAGGTFAAGRTLMHVSRGTCSELPIRWRCPPEIGKIVLRSTTVNRDAA